MFDIGIIGGMGPQSCAYLFDFIVKNTIASKDQEHPSIIILNDTKIPDRSNFLLGLSKTSPIHSINSNIIYLDQIGTSVIGISCNTSYCFYKDFLKPINGKIINMPSLTLKYCEDLGFKKVLVLSTLGTMKMKIYENKNFCRAEILYPNDEDMREVHKIIYDIKNSSEFDAKPIVKRIKTCIKNAMISNKLYDNSTPIILGCTELSLLTKHLREDNHFIIIDPLEIMAYSLIKESGYKCKKSKYYDFNILGKINDSGQ